MLLWTEEMHEEHFKDLLRAAEQVHIAQQERERRRKSRKDQRSIMTWIGPLLSVFAKQLQENILDVLAYFKDKGGVL